MFLSQSRVPAATRQSWRIKLVLTQVETYMVCEGADVSMAVMMPTLARRALCEELYHPNPWACAGSERSWKSS